MENLTVLNSMAFIILVYVLEHLVDSVIKPLELVEKKYLSIVSLALGIVLGGVGSFFVAFSLGEMLIAGLVAGATASGVHETRKNKKEVIDEGTIDGLRMNAKDIKFEDGAYVPEDKKGVETHDSNG